MTTKECAACGERIPKSAKLCSHCGSYQDWRSYIVSGQTTLALLIALFSVIGLVGPTIKTLFMKSHSNLAGELIDFRRGRAVFLVTNDGNAPGVVIDGTLRFTTGPLASTTGFALQLGSDDQTVVDPGSAKTVNVTSDGANIDLVATAFAAKTSDECTIQLNGRNFDQGAFAITNTALCIEIINTVFSPNSQMVYYLAKQKTK